MRTALKIKCQRANTTARRAEARVPLVSTRVSSLPNWSEEFLDKCIHARALLVNLQPLTALERSPRTRFLASPRAI